MRLIAVCGVCGGRIKAVFELDVIRDDNAVEITVPIHRCSVARLKALVRMADGSVNEDELADLKKDARL